MYGYGAIDWYVTSVDYTDSGLCNIWIEKEDKNIDIYLEDSTYPGMVVTGLNGQDYTLETYDRITNKYKMIKHGNSAEEFIDRSVVLKCIEKQKLTNNN